jgi:cyclopropane-fatty-acyl-phospholipid synthase
MHQLLSQVATGSLAVTYWDGTTEQYGNGNPACNQVKTLGITLSEEQYRETKRRIQELALEELVEVELMDYRTLAESGRTFDKVVSIGMLEHVGRANLPRYMASVDKLLAPQGLSLLHTITHLKEGPVNSWIEKYIFPGGYIPSLRELICD